jgi:hypothetical protein
VAIHGIFISRFLNYKAALVLELRSCQKRQRDKGEYHLLEIDEEERRVKQYLSYLIDWWKQSLQSKDQGDPKWHKAFLSLITFKNLRQTICAFFTYARNILAIPGEWHVPYRLANQSSIENVFGQARACHRDTAATLPKELAGIRLNKKLSTDAMKKGQQYPHKLIEQTEKTKDGISALFSSRGEQRDAKIKAWLLVRASRRDETGDEVRAKDSKVLHDAPQTVRSPSSFWLHRLYSGIDCTWSEVLISHEDFVETAKACIFEKSFFQVLFTDVSMSKERTFNKFCHSVNAMLVRAFLKRSKKGIGMYVLVYLQLAAFTSAINTFQAKELRNRTCLGLVALALFQLFLKKLRDEVSTVPFAKWDNEGSEEVGSEIWQKQTKLLVDRFVGYALSRLIETARNKQNRTKKHDTDLTYQQLELYQSM